MAKRSARLNMYVKIDKNGQFVAQTNIYRLKKPGGPNSRWAQIYPDVCCPTTTTTSTSTTTTTT